MTASLDAQVKRSQCFSYEDTAKNETFISLVYLRFP